MQRLTVSGRADWDCAHRYLVRRNNGKLQQVPLPFRGMVPKIRGNCRRGVECCASLSCGGLCAERAIGPEQSCSGDAPARSQDEQRIQRPRCAQWKKVIYVNREENHTIRTCGSDIRMLHHAATITARPPTQVAWKCAGDSS
jgi:hypothetical protein